MAQNLTNLLYFKIVMISYKIINYYICRIDLMELAEKLFFWDNTKTEKNRLEITFYKYKIWKY